MLTFVNKIKKVFYMEYIKLDLKNNEIMHKLYPLYINYETEISKALVEEIFDPKKEEENYMYFKSYFSRGITTYICVIKGDFKGFISFHVDSKEIPGYADGYHGNGHLAEIYVKKDMRGLGLGKQMVKKAEEELLKLSMKKVYLTDLSGNDRFWKSMNYIDTGKIEIKEGGRIYEKILSTNDY